MSVVDQSAVYGKLDAIKEIRNKTIQVEKLRNRIIQEVQFLQREEKCISEFKQEMDLLLQEKMSHVEELRQIHADINAMEGVIKHAEESRSRSLNSAVRFHEEYLPLKVEVDRLRKEYLGLERMPELHEEEGSLITAERFAQFMSTTKNNSQTFIKTSDWTRPLPPSNIPLNPITHSLAPTFLSPPTPLRLVTKPEAGRSSTLASQHSGPPTPTFRQQPPPMKNCLSCHQQIHRNAPICPLCKAKSRSRNPKKPKKK